MSSGLIQPLLQRLVGVYADPLRISRDAAQLLNRVEGNALTPLVSQSMEHPRVLSFVGTIGMTYRGVKYNIPVEIFLPPNYPTYPPICYVRPSVGMMLKENHKHVGPDGKIYMPYLHNWKSYSCNLVDLVLTMSSIFSAEPPCYAKPVPVVQGVTNILSEEDRRKEQEFQEILKESKRLEEERQQRELRILENEKKELERLQKLSIEEEKRAQQTRLKLTIKVQDHLKSYYSTIRQDIRAELINQSKLQSGRKDISEQKKTLTNTKAMLQSQISELNQHTSEISEAIQKHAAASKERKPVDVDELAKPTDARSRQILDLVVTDASLTDCLFFVDKGLFKGKLTLDDHLKQVRKLAKQQFMVRAHLMKIIQINNTLRS